MKEKEKCDFNMSMDGKTNHCDGLDLQEQLQIDLGILCDDYLIDELGEEYENFEYNMAEIVIHACKHYTLNKDETD